MSELNKVLGLITVWDLLLTVLIIVALMRSWESSKPRWVRLLVCFILLIGAYFAITYIHNVHLFAPKAVAESAKEVAGNVQAGAEGAIDSTTVVGEKTKKGPHFPWWLIQLGLVVIITGITTMQAVKSSRKKPWFGNKPDYWAVSSTIVTGLSLSLVIVFFNHFLALVSFIVVAILATISIMNVQVPEQEFWTPKLFGERCYGGGFMLGKVCLRNGFNWFLIPRNFPGLTFNVAKPRKGVALECVTENLPTKGAKIDGVNGETVIVGGGVDIKFTLYLDTCVATLSEKAGAVGPTAEGLEAYYSSPDNIRTDEKALAKYASGIYDAAFRDFVRSKTLEEIQTQVSFKGKKDGDKDKKDDGGIDLKDFQNTFEGNTGHKVTKCLVNDPTPSPKVQAELDALAAKRIEALKSFLEAKVDIARAEGRGKAYLAEIKPLVDALNNSDTSQATREAIAAVSTRDFAGHSNLRVLVEKQLGGLAPFMAEQSEANT